MFCFRKAKISKLASDSAPNSQIVTELDHLVATYNAIAPKHIMDKYNCFWNCHRRICELYDKHSLFIYAGDCEFDHLRSIIENDGPEYAAIIIFGASAADYYMIGVCVRGNPILRKVDLGSKNVKKTIQAMSGRIGSYFQE